MGCNGPRNLKDSLKLYSHEKISNSDAWRIFCNNSIRILRLPRLSCIQFVSQGQPQKVG